MQIIGFSQPHSKIREIEKMKYSKQLASRYRMDVFLLASPVYWPNGEARASLFTELQLEMELSDADRWNVYHIDSAEAAQAIRPPTEDRPCVIVALSGGVQPWLQIVCGNRQHIAVFNAYLPEAIKLELSGKLMHANAHPSSTDFFAASRLGGKSVQWLSQTEEVHTYADAWQAVCRLKNAHFLKVGETEPWVINSCREPEIITKRIGCKVSSIERETLYSIYENISEEEASEEAKRWVESSQHLTNITYLDVLKASRVTLAMRQMIDQHQADGLSMACFTMIGDIDTTSCLALSALNDSAYDIGACEGDLDAALTLYLLKALGADFVWIANPIIHADNTIDLAHCTAPTCACGSSLQYRLMRHHESGRGVAPEVQLPGGQTASACRLSVSAGEIACHVGTTEKTKKLPACHTQIRFNVESSKKVINTLLGTHLVLSYGDYGNAVQYAASFLGFTSQASRLAIGQL